MSVSIRTLLVPGVAFATAGAVALGPAMVAPPAVTLAQPVVQLPVVTIPDVQLAGFTLDLYNALNGWAQFGVQVAQDFFFWNPGFATLIGNVYTSLEPIVTAVVSFIDTLASGPADIIGALTSLVSSVLGIGLPSLTAASVGHQSVARAAAAHKSASPRPAAAEPVLSAPAADIAAETTADVPAPARASRGETRRAVRSAAVGARQAAHAAAAKAPGAAQTAEVSVASADRGTARVTRGSVATASRQARAGVTAAAEPAS